MGYGTCRWMSEFLRCLDDIVTNNSKSGRLQEDCDFLSRRTARVQTGKISWRNSRIVVWRHCGPHSLRVVQLSNTHQEWSQYVRDCFERPSGLADPSKDMALDTWSWTERCPGSSFSEMLSSNCPRWSLGKHTKRASASKVCRWCHDPQQGSLPVPLAHGFPFVCLPTPSCMDMQW